MPTYAVHYTYAEAGAAGRDTHRPEHRRWLQDHAEEGRVLTAGAYSDGSGALILLQADTAEAAQTLLNADPFVRAEVVDGIRIVEWRPTIGAFAQ